MLTKRRVYHPMYSHLLNKYHNRDYSKCEPVVYSRYQRTTPAVNIFETEDQFEIHVAAPGMSKKDFKIELDNDLLTISADIKDEKEDKFKYSKIEYDYRSFERRFRLPKDSADSDKISAKYENGELFLIIPKKEEAKDLPPKNIEIK
jgi:HSP20 family protein